MEIIYLTNRTGQTLHINEPLAGMEPAPGVFGLSHLVLVREHPFRRLIGRCMEKMDPGARGRVLFDNEPWPNWPEIR